MGHGLISEGCTLSVQREEALDSEPKGSEPITSTFCFQRKGAYAFVERPGGEDLLTLGVWLLEIHQIQGGTKVSLSL